MKTIDIHTWNRKQHFEHFTRLKDPYFGITFKADVAKAYAKSKADNISFFVTYLHACMKAINAVDNLRYRIVNDAVIDYDVIHASATILRNDGTFGFSFITYHDDLQHFNANFEAEKTRILNSSDLFPPQNSLDCIHCSALPWVAFTGHKEPVSGQLESVPKLAFSKTFTSDGQLCMTVAISANHALVDGYHIGQFAEKFQDYLNV